MVNEWAIMDDNGVIVDGSYGEIMEIWTDVEYDYGVEIKGDLVLIKICGRKR